MRQLLIVPAMLLAACGGGASFASDGDESGIAPTGSGNQRSYAATGFQRVGVSGPDNVIVQVGPAFSVRAEGDPAVLDRLLVKVKGDRLQLGRKRDWSSGQKGTARFTVTLPTISDAAVAGSGSMTVDRVQGEAFQASVAGSGNLSVGQMRASILSASIAGSGDFTTSGSADMLDASIAGSGSVLAGGLTAKAAEVSIAGSGSVTAKVVGEADVSIVGSGSAILGPQAKCKLSRVGSGEARCG